MMKRNHTGKVTELTRLPMNKEQILQLVKEHFQEGGVRDDGSCSEYYGDPDAFVKFYRKAYSEGWREGNEEGVNYGYDKVLGADL
jgi:hypothetical protein